MIHWAHTPHEGLKRIIDDSIDYIVDMLKMTLDTYPWEDEAPNERIIKMFPNPQVYIKTLTAIQKANNDEKNTYTLNEYHWALLYFALGERALLDEEIVTNGTQEEKELYQWFKETDTEILEMKEYDEDENDYLKDIVNNPNKAFDYIVDHYFFDTDFLMESNMVNNPNTIQKKQMRFEDSLFGVVNNMPISKQQIMPKQVTDQV